MRSLNRVGSLWEPFSRKWPTGVSKGRCWQTETANAIAMPPMQGTVYIGFEDFQERSRDFCFSSFLTKPEIIKIIVQVRTAEICCI